MSQVSIHISEKRGLFGLRSHFWQRFRAQILWGTPDDIDPPDTFDVSTHGHTLPVSSCK